MSEITGDRPPSAGSSRASSTPAAETQAALALARAAVKVLLESSPEVAVRLRAELRKEAVGLDMKEGVEAKAAAAALRRLLDAA
jgi:hypothetical protein